jgi:hypothetical protein
MNKHFLFTMLAASTMVLATGCSGSDDTAVTPENNSLAAVSFSVQADAVAGTRAISDGTGADELIYRVFDKEGHVISASLAKKTETGLTDLLTGHKVTLYLAKGQTYKVAFWAQDADCTAYTVDDNMGVTVSYTGTNNDETRDAFFKTVDVTVTGDMSVDVTLKRPFAQINVGCTTDDWNAAQASNINVKTSAVTIKDAATKLNVIDGTVTGSQDVTYTAAAIPNETLKVDADGDGTKEEYNYLSMCYILPNETTTGAAKTTAGTTFTFHPQTGNDITLSDGLQAIPVQRNYRTNIVGKILSGEVSLNVKVDPIYEGEYVKGEAYINGVAYPTIQKAIDAATANSTIEVMPGTYPDVLNLTSAILADNITIKPFGATRASAKEVVIAGINSQHNANSRTVSFEGITVDNSLATENWCIGTSHVAPCVGAWGGNLNFTGCKFVVDGGSGKETGVMTWWTTGICTMNFKNCTFEPKTATATEARGMQIYGHYNLNVEGCTFTTAKRYSLKYVGQKGCTANLTNNTVKNAKYFVEVGSEPYKGTEYTINITGNTFGKDIKAYKEGYTDAVTTEKVNVTESDNTTLTE